MLRTASTKVRVSFCSFVAKPRGRGYELKLETLMCINLPVWVSVMYGQWVS